MEKLNGIAKKCESKKGLTQSIGNSLENNLSYVDSIKTDQVVLPIA